MKQNRRTKKGERGNLKKSEADQWSRTRQIQGKLSEIDKDDEHLTLLYQNDNEGWITESFSTRGWTDEAYEKLKQCLGDEISLTIQDDRATSWWQESA